MPRVSAAATTPPSGATPSWGRADRTYGGGLDLGRLAREALLARCGRLVLARDRLCGGLAVGGQQRRSGRGGRELRQRQAVALQARERARVDRRATGAGLGEREHRGDQHGVVLVAALGDPRALWGVHLADGGDHRAGDEACGDGRQRAEREERAADRLGGPGRGGVALAGLQAELALEEAGRAFKPVAPEPAEQLLGPVPHEQRADDQAKCGASNVHVDLHTCEIARASTCLSTPAPWETGDGPDSGERVAVAAAALDRGKESRAEVRGHRRGVYPLGRSFHRGGGPGSVCAFLRGRSPSSCSVR